MTPIKDGSIVAMSDNQTETSLENTTAEHGRICPKCGCDKPKVVFSLGRYVCENCTCNKVQSEVG